MHFLSLHVCPSNKDFLQKVSSCLTWNILSLFLRLEPGTSLLRPAKAPILFRAEPEQTNLSPWALVNFAENTRDRRLVQEKSLYHVDPRGSIKILSCLTNPSLLSFRPTPLYMYSCKFPRITLITTLHLCPPTFTTPSKLLILFPILCIFKPMKESFERKWTVTSFIMFR